MVWLGRDIKDDLVPTLLSWAGAPSTSWGFFCKVLTSSIYFVFRESQCFPEGFVPFQGILFLVRRADAVLGYLRLESRFVLFWAVSST